MLERIPLLQGYPMTPINPGPNLLRKRTRKQVLLDFLQQWFGLSDAAMEETLYDPPLYRVFSGTDVFEDQRSAAREGVDAAFGHGRRFRADPVIEQDGELIGGLFPDNRRHFPVLLDVAQSEKAQFFGGLIIGEMAAVFDDF